MAVLRKDRSHPSADGAYLPVYLSASNIKSCIDDELMVALNAPIVYLPRTGGKAFLNWDIPSKKAPVRGLLFYPTISKWTRSLNV